MKKFFLLIVLIFLPFSQVARASDLTSELQNFYDLSDHWRMANQQEKIAREGIAEINRDVRALEREQVRVKSRLALLAGGAAITGGAYLKASALLPRLNVVMAFLEERQ